MARMTSRGWFYTNNAVSQAGLVDMVELEGDESVSMDDFVDLGATYHVFQYEIAPTTGRRHQQGYLHFRAPIRMSALTKVNASAHWEPRKGTVEQAVAYCKKEETRDCGPFEEGVMPGGQGARNDLKEACSELLTHRDISQLAVDRPHMLVKYHRGMEYLLSVTAPMQRDPVQVFLLLGPSGIGKSHYCHRRFPTAWRSVDPRLTWFDGYRGQSTVILEEISAEAMPNIGTLLRVLDIYPLQVAVKGGFAWWRPTEIWITSQTGPQDWYPGIPADRLTALCRRITTVYSLPEVPPPEWEVNPGFAGVEALRATIESSVINLI